PGEVVVGAVQSRANAAIWGELLSTHTRAKGGRGVVLDGLSRDSWGIAEMKFPVFARGLSPADSKGRLEVIAIRGTIPVAGVSVSNGDLLLADEDGVVVVPRDVEDEVDDGEDAMAWLGSLPFSNGRIGMYGFSYPGHTQLQIAARKHDGLRCMVPAMTSPDLYEGWAYNNGAFALAFNASWATFLADDVARRRDPDSEPLLAAQYAKVNDYYWWLPLSAIPNLTPGSPGGFFADWLAHETKDDYWKRWDVTTKLPSIDVPAMAVGGLYDVFLEGTMANYSGIRRGPASADT